MKKFISITYLVLCAVVCTAQTVYVNNAHQDDSFIYLDEYAYFVYETSACYGQDAQKAECILYMDTHIEIIDDNQNICLVLDEGCTEVVQFVVYQEGVIVDMWNKP